MLYINSIFVLNKRKKEKKMEVEVIDLTADDQLKRKVKDENDERPKPKRQKKRVELQEENYFDNMLLSVEVKSFERWAVVIGLPGMPTKQFGTLDS